MKIHFSYVHTLLVTLLIILLSGYVASAQETALSKAGISIIPYPKEVKIKGSDYVFSNATTITLDENASENDKFAADQLSKYLLEEYAIKTSIQQKPSQSKSIILTRKGNIGKVTEEGYSLTADGNKLVVRANGEAGLFYGVQTIYQLIQTNGREPYIKGMEILDWPDTKVRAAHYDTKHHQDKKEYVEKFIKDLARYKTNMMVWEWEDKFAYPSHPEIGAPGAFSMQEMQELTRYAKKFHIQITPLVQGLGHVSFILKWPQHAHLREIAASNFEFCPLKEGSYKLLYDLWEDAIKATPGSEYIHIGSDETYELGKCADCQKKVEEIGKGGLYHLFTTNAVNHLSAKNRKIMVWERPMGWTKGEGIAKNNIAPVKGMVLTESYDYETPDLKYAKEAKAKGYPVFAYDPNPGVEPLFLPYFFRYPNDFGPERISGSLENSYEYLTSHLGKNVYDGVICTSWDDAGLHNQAWMMRFAASAAFSWNAAAPSLSEFTSSFFNDYYGRDAKDMHKVYFQLNEGSYFYLQSMERQLWHHKSIGRTTIPDLPRGDGIEYNPYWNKEYAGEVKKANEMLLKMDSVKSICKVNLEGKVKNAYDFEIFETIADMVKHTAQTYVDLSELENAIAAAHEQRNLSYEEAYRNLEKAEKIIERHLAERDSVVHKLVSTWEKTRLPKGMSTNNKKFLFEQDRTIHFANRTADMSFLVLDEQKLDLETYLIRLKDYKKYYHDRFLKREQ
ncbi:MAG TPA: beta-N-acetylhexosaminidase [Flavitalea sp.]|nr:beta-N-acetylhexosaminidase [Flavitalea sp.]